MNRVDEVIELERMLHPGLADDEIAVMLLRENALAAERLLVELARNAEDRKVRAEAYQFILHLALTGRNPVPLALWQRDALLSLVWVPEEE